MRNNQQTNNIHSLMTNLAAIRGREQSCDRCGQVKLTLPMGRANFCLDCTERISAGKQQARRGK